MFRYERLDVLITPRVEAGFERLAANSEKIKLRTPDSYLVGRSNISWVALNEITRPLIDEMKYTVRKHRPLISGKVFSDNAEEILEWCELHSYLPINNTLKPLCNKGYSDYCWLVPNEELLDDVRKLLAADRAVLHPAKSLSKFALQVWPELTESSDKLAKQTIDYITNARRWYYLDKLVNIGMYPIETDGTYYWRWLGHKGVRLFIPLRAIGFYTIKFIVFFPLYKAWERVGAKGVFLNGVTNAKMLGAGWGEVENDICPLIPRTEKVELS
jgi:hypothetical protein